MLVCLLRRDLLCFMSNTETVGLAVLAQRCHSRQEHSLQSLNVQRATATIAIPLFESTGVYSKQPLWDRRDGSYLSGMYLYWIEFVKGFSRPAQHGQR